MRQVQDRSQRLPWCLASAPVIVVVVVISSSIVVVVVGLLWRDARLDDGSKGSYDTVMAQTSPVRFQRSGHELYSTIHELRCYCSYKTPFTVFDYFDVQLCLCRKILYIHIIEKRMNE